MKTSNKIQNGFVYSNLLISLGAVALCTQTFILNELELNPYYFIFVFTSTFISYNIQRLVREKEIQMVNPKLWIISHKKTIWVLVGIASFFPFFSFFYFFDLTVLYWLIPVAIISFFYSYKGLRNIPYLKIFLISISWGIICGILPFIISNEINITGMVINFCVVFLYIFSITIPFDIRDKGLDEDNKRTIPQVLGEKNAKITALVLLGIYFLISAYSFSFYFLPLILSVISAGVLIHFSSEKKEDMYFSFWIDGHILLQFFGIMLIYFTKYA